MKVFTCNDHDTIWVGGASVVVAEDEKQGRKLLDKELKAAGLEPWWKRRYSLKEIDITKAKAIILQNGDY